MNRRTAALTGFGLGAGLMYLFDPGEGRRRRARLRDALVHASNRLGGAACTASRDLEHRAAGMAARARTTLTHQDPPGDDVLKARVRARVGRLVSHPGAIEVKVQAGKVVLSGPVFAAEVDQLVRGVERVRGVTEVDDRLEPHAEAGDVPALQGPGPLELSPVPAALRWTPTTRVAAGTAGLALMALASRTRTLRSAAAGLAGFELLERAVRGRRSVA